MNAARRRRVLARVVVIAALVAVAPAAAAEEPTTPTPIVPVSVRPLTAIESGRNDANPVWARSGREQLLAQTSGQILLVNRWLDHERRVLVMNLQSDDLPLSRVTPSLRLRGARTLLSSAPEGESLPPGGAIVLAGNGNLAGLVEGRS